jgi:hypothetical protein
VSAEKVIFLHLHKTGGLSANAVMHRQYIGQRGAVIHKDVPAKTRALLDMPQAERDRLTFITGHVYYGIHEIWSSPSSYFTFLREPISRAVSAYNFLGVIPKGLVNPAIRGEFETFLRDPRRTTYLTTRIAGYVPGRPGELYAESGTAPADVYAAAQSHLGEMRVVGITEEFDTTLLLLRRAFGWRNIFYVRRNTTSEKGKVIKLSTELRAELSPLYAHETALYERAKQLFSEQCRAYGPSLEHDLRRFRRNNALYGRLFGATFRLRDTSLYSVIRKMTAGLFRA